MHHFDLAIVNVYRHPGEATQRKVLIKLFDIVASFEHALIVGNLNAHHYTWNEDKTARAGEMLSRCLEERDYSVLNDGQRTFITPPNTFQSVIDLVMASEKMVMLCQFTILEDPGGSDHLPIKTVVQGEHQNICKFFHKVKLKERQLREVAYNLRSLFEPSSELPDEASACIGENPAERYNEFIDRIKVAIASACTVCRGRGRGS